MKAAKREVVLGLVFLLISLPLLLFAFAFPQESRRGIDTRVLAILMVAIAIGILLHGVYLGLKRTP